MKVCSNKLHLANKLNYHLLLFIKASFWFRYSDFLQLPKLVNRFTFSLMLTTSRQLPPIQTLAHFPPSYTRRVPVPPTMFVPRSPAAGEKRKRSRTNSARPGRSTVHSLRFSPPPGHRNAQAMTQHHSMPFIYNDSNEGASWDQASLSSGSDSSIPHSSSFQARHSEPLRLASEPRNTRPRG